MLARTVALGCLLGTALPTPRASACDCIVPGIGLVAPADGAVDVPRNARVWLGNYLARPGAVVALTKVSDESSVATDGSTISVDGALRVRVLTPDEPLLAGERYRVLVDGTAVTTFMVGDALDEEPPSAPLLEIAGTKGALPIAMSCGGLSDDDSWVRVSVNHGEALAIIDRDQTSGFDPGLLAGEVTAVVGDDSVQLGSGACANGWSAAAPLASGSFRAAAIDVAGNISAFSEPTLVTLPPPGCTCSNLSVASSRAGSGLLALGLITLFSLAPRRRRRPARAT